MATKVNLYYSYSKLDKVHYFGIECDESVWLCWICYYIGQKIKNNRGIVRFVPFKTYDGKLIKTYTTNGCEKVANYIVDRFKKIDPLIQKENYHK